MTVWYRKLTWYLQRGRREDTLREELEFHLAEDAEERHADGMGTDAAMWAARRDLGNQTIIQEDARTLWTWHLLEDVVRDLRYAGRAMRRSFAVTVVAALTLALGIGANTAIYSFMDAVLLRRLPVPEPEALVVLKWHSQPFSFREANAFVLHSVDGQVYDEAGGKAARIFPWPAFERLQTVAAPFMSSFFAYHGAGRLNIVARGEADIVNGEYVSGAYFAGLRLLPAVGRPIVEDDDRVGADPVAVLSYRYARRHFGDPSAAVGQLIRINNATVTVIGVTPPEFFGVDPNVAPDVYLPLHAGEVSTDPNGYWLEMMGRLRPGVDAARAQGVIAATFQTWVATTASNEQERGNLPQLRLDSAVGGLDTLRRKYSQPLAVLMGLVGLILAIACANTANLLLARATARRREMAVRLSLGAARWRLIRQLLTESVCLGCLSGALSLPIAFASMRVLTTLVTNGREAGPLRAELNWHVLMITFALSVVCGLFVGLGPALQAARPQLTPALKGAPLDVVARSRVGVLRLTLTQALVIAQIAISLLLLMGAGLFVRTLLNLESIPLGFNAVRLLLFDVNARQAGHAPADIARFYAELQGQLRAVPGVTAVTMSHASLIRAGRSLPLQVNGRPATGARVLSVGPRFFSTMDIPVSRGRAIDERDEPGKPMVAVVDDVFARTFFANESAVGRHLTFDGPFAQQLLASLPSSGAFSNRAAAGAGGAVVDVEIIGVAASAHYGGVRDPQPPVVYFSYGQLTRPPIAQMTFALRTTGDPLSSVSAVRSAIRQVDAQLPITSIRSQTDEIDQNIGQEILFARLCTAFALLALVIASVGLYGTMAYAVARRTREIGIRLALGARGSTIAWTVLREVCVLAVAGLTISLPIALVASRAVEVFLYNVTSNDPATFAVAVAVMVAATMLAGAGPAHRAARVTPMTTLRAE